MNLPNETVDLKRNQIIQAYKLDTQRSPKINPRWFSPDKKNVSREKVFTPRNQNFRKNSSLLNHRDLMIKEINMAEKLDNLNSNMIINRLQSNRSTNNSQNKKATKCIRVKLNKDLELQF